ncbi:MAG: hypothetical protein ACK5EA_30265 [Planctomycetaceae bacterium]|jgi:hypothetical protein
MRSLLTGMVSFAVVCAVGVPLAAQEFRVYTRIFNERADAAARKAGKQPAPVSRTTTVFHAGKVYDFIDAGDRITIYEPSQERFLILDGARQLRTEIKTSEIASTIRSIERKQQERLESEVGTERDDERLQLIQFQLNPDFTESIDEQSLALKLSGTGAEYTLKCVVSESPEYARAYLDYADWAARLNYLLHENAPLPGPRLALDESLRRKGWLPLEVSMQGRSRNSPHLRAEHRYDWKLDAADRKLITKAENEIGQPKMKEVDFATFYQRIHTRNAQARR